MLINFGVDPSTLSGSTNLKSDFFDQISFLLGCCTLLEDEGIVENLGSRGWQNEVPGWREAVPTAN